MPWVLPRVIPPGGAVVAGRHFAGGVEIGMSPYVFQRRKEAYGEDAKVFRPERWIEATTTTMTNGEERKMLDKNLLTFGQGNRICVGKARRRLTFLLKRTLRELTPTAAAEHCAHGAVEISAFSLVSLPPRLYPSRPARLASSTPRTHHRWQDGPLRTVALREPMWVHVSLRLKAVG